MVFLAQTLSASASVWFYKFVRVLFAIVIDEFLACFNILDRIYKNAPPLDLGLAVRLAGVVDVAGGVGARQ
jgi:hypothetical protein